MDTEEPKWPKMMNLQGTNVQTLPFLRFPCKHEKVWWFLFYREEEWRKGKQKSLARKKRWAQTSLTSFTQQFGSDCQIAIPAHCQYPDVSSTNSQQSLRKSAFSWNETILAILSQDCWYSFTSTESSPLNFPMMMIADRKASEREGEEANTRRHNPRLWEAFCLCS